MGRMTVRMDKSHGRTGGASHIGGHRRTGTGSRMLANWRAALATLLILLPASQLFAQPTTPQELEAAIEMRIEQASIPNATIGILITDLATRDTLYARNAGKSFVPASNVKLYTTAAVLDQLGPDFRYRTVFYGRGEKDNTMFEGDLIIRGSGDPTFSAQFHDGRYGRVLTDWSRSLRARNITNIEGDVIGDDNVFNDVPYGVGWSWDDFPFYYSAEIGGLNFNDNAIELTLATSGQDNPAQISLEPAYPGYVQFVSTFETRGRNTDDDLNIDRRLGTNIFELKGRLPAYTTVESTLAIHNPTLYFLYAFDRALEQEQIAVRGEFIDVDVLGDSIDYTDPDMQTLATYVSPPLAAIASATNKPSNNLYAEILLRTLGVERPVPDARLEEPDTRPGSTEMGIAAAERTYARAGIDTSRLELYDGSGLSRFNLVTPTMTNRLLTYMWRHPDADTRSAWYESLAVSGREGTLERRLTTGPSRGNVRGKTGTLTHVSSLSGYVTSVSGDPLIFSIMSNNHTTDSDVVRDLQDAIVRLLATYRE